MFELETGMHMAGLDKRLRISACSAFTSSGNALPCSIYYAAESLTIWRGCCWRDGDCREYHILPSPLHNQLMDKYVCLSVAACFISRCWLTQRAHHIQPLLWNIDLMDGCTLLYYIYFVYHAADSPITWKKSWSNTWGILYSSRMLGAASTKLASNTYRGSSSACKQHHDSRIEKKCQTSHSSARCMKYVL